METPHDVCQVLSYIGRALVDRVHAKTYHYETPDSPHKTYFTIVLNIEKEAPIVIETRHSFEARVLRIVNRTGVKLQIDCLPTGFRKKMELDGLPVIPFEIAGDELLLMLRLPGS